jgi:hypothetical protein
MTFPVRGAPRAMTLILSSLMANYHQISSRARVSDGLASDLKLNNIHGPHTLMNGMDFSDIQHPIISVVARHNNDLSLVSTSVLSTFVALL